MPLHITQHFWNKMQNLEYNIKLLTIVKEQLGYQDKKNLRIPFLCMR